MATCLSRIPFATTYLWEWDSVLYARALEHGLHVSDVLAVSRPHPPGYIFYVGAAALARTFGLGSNAALVTVSVVASGAAAALIYLLCARLAGRTIALLIAVAFATSPLVWLDSEIAMPYAVLAALSTLLALSFLSARGGSPRAVTTASLVFGLAAGARQDLLIFLGPLWLWSIAPSPGRVRARALLALAAGCVAWLGPSMLLSDGPLAYLDSVRRQVATVSGSTGMAPGTVATGTAVVFISLAWGLAAAGLVLLVLLVSRALGAATRRAPPGRLAAFFALWILPALAFYSFVHIGEWGYVLSVVPGLFALTAHLLSGPYTSARPRARVATAVALAAAAVAGGALFLGGGDAFSAAALADHDRATATKVDAIRSRYPVDSTVVVAGAELLVAGHYLPGYELWFSDERATGTNERHTSRDTTVVIYEQRARPRSPDVGAAARDASGLVVITLPGGTTVVLNGRDVDPGPR